MYVWRCLPSALNQTPQTFTRRVLTQGPMRRAGKIMDYRQYRGRPDNTEADLRGASGEDQLERRARNTLSHRHGRGGGDKSLDHATVFISPRGIPRRHGPRTKKARNINMVNCWANELCSKKEEAKSAASWVLGRNRRPSFYRRALNARRVGVAKPTPWLDAGAICCRQAQNLSIVSNRPKNAAKPTLQSSSCHPKYSRSLS